MYVIIERERERERLRDRERERERETERETERLRERERERLSQKVLSPLTVYSKYTCALTFENICKAHALEAKAHLKTKLDGVLAQLEVVQRERERERERDEDVLLPRTMYLAPTAEPASAQPTEGPMEGSPAVPHACLHVSPPSLTNSARLPVFYLLFSSCLGFNLFYFILFLGVYALIYLYGRSSLFFVYVFLSELYGRRSVMDSLSLSLSLSHTHTHTYTHTHTHSLTHSLTLS